MLFIAPLNMAIMVGFFFVVAFFFLNFLAVRTVGSWFPDQR